MAYIVDSRWIDGKQLWFAVLARCQHDRHSEWTNGSVQGVGMHVETDSLGQILERYVGAKVVLIVDSLFASNVYDLSAICQ